MDYWWRNGGVNGFSDSLFEEQRDKKKKKK
jgi:hypothetical protein